MPGLRACYRRRLLSCRLVRYADATTRPNTTLTLNIAYQNIECRLFHHYTPARAPMPRRPRRDAGRRQHAALRRRLSVE